MNVDKKFIWLAVLIVGVILILVSRSGDGPSYFGGGTPTPSPTPTSTPTPTQSPGTIAKPAKTSPQRYADALKQYADRRIQFDVNCQASPNNITVKNGTSIMFDNRSGEGRWIALDATGYFIDGYGFRIIPLSSKSLPHTVRVNCGSAVNVGQVLLQK